MLCHFLDGMEVVTLLTLLPYNQTSPIFSPYQPGPPTPRPPRPDPPAPPPGWRGSLQTDVTTMFQARVTGGWHNHAPGETRVHLNYSGLVTFYDPTLSSLVARRQ